MSKWLQGIVLACILLLAAVLRFTGIDWDNYDHHHPDERYITWVATTIEWPDDWRRALNPAESTFNPYYWAPNAASKGIEVPQDEGRKFAYGHFPLYLGVGITRLVERLSLVVIPYLPPDWFLTKDFLNGAEMVEYRHLTAVTRALTALVDVGTVWLLFALGRRLYGPGVGLLAAAFLALNVMHVQLAHFFAFDPYMTFFVVAAVYFMVLSLGDECRAEGAEDGAKIIGGIGSKTRRRAHSLPSSWYLLFASIATGLAVGSKFAAILLLFPLTLALYRGGKQGRPKWQLWLPVGIGLVAFLISNPFAVLDQNCEVITPAVNIGPLSIPALNWGYCFLDNVGTQGAMVRGDVDLAFTRQYQGTLPFLYYIEMQLRWGMGPFLGIIAFVGFGWVAYRGANWGWNWFRRESRERDGSNSLSTVPVDLGADWPSIILLAWTIPFFIVTGGFYVKFMRYMQPLTPFLMLYGAVMLWEWRRVAWRRLVTILVLLTTGLYAWSFVNIYQEPHPWTAASQWVYANVPPGTLILSEQWDDALPVSMILDGRQRRRSEYQDRQLTWMTRTGSRDDEVKLADNLNLLAEAEYLTIVTNRVYGVVPRLPDRYPLSSQYHQLLFDGSLGYEVVAVYGRYPNLFGFHLKPDTFGWPGLEPPTPVADTLSDISGINWGRVDESFTVYDQPLTIIFENVEDISAAEMRRLFAGGGN